VARLPGRSIRCLTLSCAAARLPSADIAISVPTAAIRPSRITCRNRHCPKCQTNARDQWVRKRQQELLPVGYYHVVFSVPHLLVPLMWQNKRQLFALLFEASAAALLEVAADPRYLGAQAGLLSILHSWGTDPPASPAYPLRRARRRSVAGSHPVDLFTL
jgi:Transposase zinc-binding domain